MSTTSPHSIQYLQRYFQRSVAIGLTALALGACSPTASSDNTASQPSATASATATQSPETSSAVLTAAIADYKVYVEQETAQLRDQTKKFTQAVIAGDLKTAQATYAPTRLHYERIEPIAELFSDLDGSMDARADDYAQKEKDPNFTGFHRLEYSLFNQKTTAGLKPLADRLMADVTKLHQTIAGLKIQPKVMVGGSAALIEEVARTKITGEEDRYSHTDLWDFNANVEGSQKIVNLLRPMLQTSDAALLSRIDANFAKINTGLAEYKTPDGGFETYSKLNETDRKDLQATISTLAEDLSQLRGTLGIE